MNRDPYFDNLKFLLILLVVIGHGIAPLIVKSQSLHLLKLMIYSFHMPLFALISGYFAKDLLHDRGVFQHLKKYLLIYLVYSLIHGYMFYRDITVIITPVSLAWFLLSLVTWYIMLPLFSRWKGSILLAIVISLLAGHIDGIGAELSMGRTLVFLPFFVVGYHFRQSGLSVPRKPVLALVMPLILLLLIYGNVNYGSLFEGVSAFPSNLRFLHLAIAFTMSFCFMAVVPRQQTIFTHLGSQTLFVYLVHGPIYTLLKRSGFFVYIDTPFEYVCLIAGCIVISFALAYIPLSLSHRQNITALKLNNQ